jgi:hypothetical protein
MQYQTIITGATPFAPVYSGFLLDGTTGGKTILSVTNTKVLTLLATDTYTVTVAGTASIAGTNTGDVTLAATNHGLGLSGQVITLGTPSTLTVSSTNAVVTTSHTHAITTSSNPGAAASILASTAAGLLTLVGLTTTAVASLTTPAESWIGPSATNGIYFLNDNVGVGTPTPAYKLEVVDTTSSVTRFVSTVDSSPTGGAGMVGGSDDGAALASGDRLGFLYFAGAYDTSHTLTDTAGIFGYATEDWNSTHKGTRLAFLSMATGGVSRTEWMTLKDGWLGLGTPTPYSLLHAASPTGAIVTISRNDAIVTANDLIGQIDFKTNDTQTTTNPIAAQIKVNALNTISTDINPGVVTFSVTGTEVGGALLEFMSASATTKPLLSFYGGTRVVRGAALTEQLTTVTFTAPGTPDFAWGAGTNTNAYGWTTNDEFKTAASVIANLQTRVAELEARLRSTTGVNLFA